MVGVEDCDVRTSSGKSPPTSQAIKSSGLSRFVSAQADVQAELAFAPSGLASSHRLARGGTGAEEGDAAAAPSDSQASAAFRVTGGSVRQPVINLPRHFHHSAG
jgi:hypothetical protein